MTRDNPPHVKQRMPRRLILTVCGALCLGVITPDRVWAQARDTTHCCTVVRIDAGRREVTARETATGYTFLVEVKNRKHLAAVRIGDKVWANFAVRKVRLEAAGDSLCCAIVQTKELEPPAQGHEEVRFPVASHPHRRS